MGRVTIAGLAERLGMSKASVSYALNGQPGVSDHTRERVLALAAELGWYPSSSARALSHARSGAVGIVLSRDAEQIGSEPYYMGVLAGIESVLGANDMSLMLRMVGAGAGRDLAVYERWAGERRVDGVILFDQLAPDPRLDLLERVGLPFVLHGASGPAAGFPATTVDQSADAATLVRQLHSLGHRRIAYVSGPLKLVHEVARRSAVLAHAEALGLAAVSVEADYTADGGDAATVSLVAAAVRPTAVVYGNDLMALGGMAALRRLGIGIPADVSVVSWDDSILCRLGFPGVAALKRNPHAQGRGSAQLLLDVMAGNRPANVRAPDGQFELRGSLAAPKS